MGTDFFGFAYAATVAAGGIIGFVKAQSVPSLAAGLVFGGLLGFGAYQLSQNPNNLYISLGASLFLTSLMSYRFLNSGKIMPAGLVAGISIINVLRLSYRIAVPIKEVAQEVGQIHSHEFKPKEREKPECDMSN